LLVINDSDIFLPVDSAELIILSLVVANMQSQKQEQSVKQVATE